MKYCCSVGEVSSESWCNFNKLLFDIKVRSVCEVSVEHWQSVFEMFWSARQ